MPATMPKFPGAIQGRHLGRRTATPEMKKRALPLAPFLRRYGATPPPDAVDYSERAAKSLSTMLGNDQFGDCTIAAVLHETGVMTAVQPGGKERVPTTQEAVSQYPAICGAGDQGCYIPDVMDWWRDKGLTCGGQTTKADGYVSLTLADQLLAKTAIFLFGGVHLGINLPRDWYTHASPGFIWDTTTTDVVGGHSIAIVGYSSQGLRVSTWGVIGTMTWAAFSDPRWVEEAYAVLSPDWYSATGLDTHGVDVASLQAALAAIKSGGTPVIPDPTPPGPTPPTPGPGNITLTGAMQFFTEQMPITLSGQLNQAMAGAAMTPAGWLTILSDVSLIVLNITQKNWAGVIAAIEQLLTDLGIAWPASAKEELGKCLMGRK